MDGENKISAKLNATQIIAGLNDDISMEDICKALAKSPKTPWRNPVPKPIFIVTALLALITFIYFVVSNFDSNGNFKSDSAPQKIVRLDYLLYMLWTIIPPAYFFWEYLSLFPHKLDSDQLADLKYIQELASKIWAAFLFAIGIILYTKYGVK